MIGRTSITERIYRSLKERVLLGAFAPGARLDVNEIAAAEGASPTPVRNALNRLVGAGLLVSQSNEGFFAPRWSEQDLRDLYDGCAAMLAISVARAAKRRERASLAAGIDPGVERSIELQTETTFHAVMSLCANRRLSLLFSGANTSLRPARMLEGEWIANRHPELRRIKNAYESLDLVQLDRLIAVYHRRRIRLAPKIAARMQEAETSQAMDDARAGGDFA